MKQGQGIASSPRAQLRGSVRAARLQRERPKRIRLPRSLKTQSRRNMIAWLQHTRERARSGLRERVRPKKWLMDYKLLALPNDILIRKDYRDFFTDVVEENTVDLVLTAPPYAISGDTGFVAGINIKVDRFAVSMDFSKWDHTEIDLDALASGAYRALRKGGTAIIWYDLWKITQLRDAMTRAGFNMLRLIIWEDTNPVPPNSEETYLSNSREIAIVGVKGGNPTFNSEYDNGIYEMPIPRHNGKRVHPTQKSLDIFTDIVSKHSNVGDLICDPFLGSGTTVIASLNLGRRVIGCGIEPKYVKLANKNTRGRVRISLRERVQPKKWPMDDKSLTLPNNRVIRKDYRDFFTNVVEENTVDLVLTDPPYAISRETGFANGINIKVERFAVSMDFGEWDHTEIDLDSLANGAYRALRKGGTAIIWYDLWKITRLRDAMTRAGFNMLRLIIWEKTNPVPLNSKKTYLSNSREIAVVGVKGGNPTFNSECDNGIYEMPIPRHNGNRIHPTQKSLDMFADIVSKHSNAGDLICDPFMGSGTTAIASLNLGRRFIGCDIEPKYVKLANKRIEDVFK